VFINDVRFRWWVREAALGGAIGAP